METFTLIIWLARAEIGDGYDEYRFDGSHFRSRPRTRRRPISIGMRSSAMVDRKASADGARTNGASIGRSLRACSLKPWQLEAPRPSAHSTQ